MMSAPAPTANPMPRTLPRRPASAVFGVESEEIATTDAMAKAATVLELNEDLLIMSFLLLVWSDMFQ